jgi:hypothetical protein
MTDEASIDEPLLPCPFCGGTPKPRSSQVAEDVTETWVECADCQVQTDRIEGAYSDHPTAAQFWNRRSTPPSAAQVKPLPIPWAYAHKYPDQYGGTWHIGNGGERNGSKPLATMPLYWGEDVDTLARQMDGLTAERDALKARVEALSQIDEKGMGHDDAISAITAHVHEIQVLCDVFGYDPSEWLQDEIAKEIAGDRP